MRRDIEDIYSTSREIGNLNNLKKIGFFCFYIFLALFLILIPDKDTHPILLNLLAQNIVYSDLIFTSTVQGALSIPPTCQGITMTSSKIPALGMDSISRSSTKRRGLPKPSLVLKAV